MSIKVRESKARRLAEPNRESAWTVSGNSRVRELLDHVARELADEYLRLMKGARADSEGGGRKK